MDNVWKHNEFNKKSYKKSYKGYKGYKNGYNDILNNYGALIE